MGLQKKTATERIQVLVFKQARQKGQPLYRDIQSIQPDVMLVLLEK
jgi:hypothetical protein